MERVQKVIANNGYCSRRKAEELIKKGKVKINNQVVRELGTLVNPEDIIEVEDYVIEKQEKVYVLLNKPRGVVTTSSDDKKRKTVVDLIDIPVRVYPVGRLDYDTTGVLLLTNDGVLTNKMLHPSNNIEKIYIAKINGVLTPGHKKSLESGIVIDGKKTARCKVKIVKIDRKANTSIIEIMIHEGRNHQIKNMFLALGYEVIKLRRESVAFLTADGLKPGEYRFLSIKEVKILYNLINN
ncbi:MAG TPA: pseudouridine synthase [Bacilli bacterium]|nr:pseudouridine synthase [Bacilli bacterium]